MSPRTQEQNQVIQEASIKKIVDAALALFAENGYTATSIQKIAKRAGISKGLLYNYFESKDHLLREIMDRGMGYAYKAFEDLPVDAPSLAQLAVLVRQIFAELEKQAAFWRVFYSLRNLPAFHDVLGEAITERTSALRDVFTGYYQQAGVQNPERRAYVLYAVVEGIIQQYLLLGEDYPLEEVVEESIRLNVF